MRRLELEDADYWAILGLLGADDSLIDLRIRVEEGEAYGAYKEGQESLILKTPPTPSLPFAGRSVCMVPTPPPSIEDGLKAWRDE